MNIGRNILSFIVSIGFCLSTCFLHGQEISILDFTVKELDGDTLKLRDRLDPNTNYIIESMAFWCNPCIKSVNKFNYHKSYWKDRFNVDILLIEDENWDDLEYVSNKMDEFGWDLDIVVSNDLFSSAGINSIPRYYFKSWKEDSVERVYGNIEHFLLERLDTIVFSPIFDVDFKQVVHQGDCDEPEILKFETGRDTTINGVVYHLVNDVLFREDGQNGDIIRFDIESGNEIQHLKFSSPMCSRVDLTDLDGDMLTVRIVDKYQQDSVLHLVTNQMISNGCIETEIPFEFIQNIGSNAGIFFDIEDGKISSRLICHEKGNEFIYSDGELGNLCLSLGIKIPSEVLDVTMYPNPAASTLYVQLNFEGEKKIEVFAPDGQLYLSKKTNQSDEEINLLGASGSPILLVRITTDYGVVTKKIIRLTD